MIPTVFLERKQRSMLTKVRSVPPIGWLFVGLLLTVGPAQGLEVVLTPEGAEVSGASPGGEVALLSVWREVNARGGTEVTLLDEALRDEGGDGRVSFDLSHVGRPLPELSVWIAVDVTTGDTAFATPSGFKPKLAEARYQGPAGRVELELSRPVVLWIRPGLGAFHSRARDGEGRDRDRAANGRVALGPGDFSRRSGRPDQLGRPADRTAPPAFSAGDVVVGVDAGTLALVALRIP